MNSPESVVRALLRAGRRGRPAVTTLQRRERRKTARRLFVSLITVACLSGLAALAGTGWNLLREDSAFAVRQIQVVGLNRHAPADLLDALRVLRGRNLVSLSPSDVAASLAPFPWLKGFLCRKHLPNTLIVEVEEREALCTLSTPGGTFEIDGAGFAWKAPPGAGGHFALGPGLSPSDPVVQSAVSDLLRIGLVGRVTALSPARAERGLLLTTDEGWSLLVDPADLAGQWDRFQRARAWAERFAKERKTADLRWSGRVVLREPEAPPETDPPAPSGEGGPQHG